MLPNLAQLRAASRKTACRAVSSTLRNRDLSCLVSGAGPRVFSPSSLRCRAISRPARALPMFASVHCFPIGETTRAPLPRHRDASGMSEVTHTSVVPICSAIQLSAASVPSPTRTMLTFVMRGDRIGREPLLYENIDVKTRCDAVNLLAYRARISIDVNFSQFWPRSLLNSRISCR